ncbi:hypothetical protein TruAng_004118 [Truncatella angustata]|nr:hypothetical protein TruAng_004118 [Truncatella angustata]
MYHTVVVLNIVLELVSCHVELAGWLKSTTAPAASKSQAAIQQPAEHAAPVFSPTPLTDGGINGMFNGLCAPGEPTNNNDAQVDMDWDALDLIAPGILPPSPKSKLSWTAWAPRDDYVSAFSAPAHLFERSYSDFLAPLVMPDLISSFTSNIVMQMLRAFPQMMLRRETLPSFIHGHWFRLQSDTEPALPKPLVNCMGIAQMFASHNPDTRPFLWRTILLEQRSSAEKVGTHFSSQKRLPE